MPTLSNELKPMSVTLDEIDEMLLKQVEELIKHAQKNRKEVIKAYIDRGIYE